MMEFEGVILQLNGGMSYGHIKESFLNGKGVKFGGVVQSHSIMKAEGIFEVGHLNDPDGKIVYSNGSMYRGSVVFGRRHGKGEIHHKNGERYVGEWLGGLKHGYGEYWQPGIYHYKGEWILNMMWGEGVLVTEEGYQVEGKFWKN